MLRRRRLLAWIALPAAVVVLLAAAWLWLVSDTGRGWLARTVTERLTVPGQVVVDVAELAPGIPNLVEAHGVTVADGDGVWLDIGTLTIRWSPWSLLGGNLAVELVRVDAVEVLRRPSPRPASKDETKDAEGLLPSLPMPVTVDDLILRDVHLHEPVAGVEARLEGELQGRVAASGDAGLTLDMRRIDGAKGQVKGHLSYDADSGVVDVNLDAHEPQNGVIAGLLDLPGRPAVRAEAAGRGPRGAFEGHYSVSAGDGLDLEGAFSLLEDDGPKLALQAAGMLESLAPDAVRPLFDRRLRGKATLSRRDGALILEDLDLANEAARVRGRLSIGTSDDSLGGSLHLQVFEGAWLAPVIAPVGIDDADLGAELSGTLSEPVVALEGAAGRVALPDIELSQVGLNATIHAGAERLGFDGQASAAEATGGIPAALAISGQPVRVKTKGHANYGSGEVVLDTLDVTSLKMGAAGHLRIGETVAGRFKIEAGDLSGILAGAGVPGTGRLKAEVALNQAGDGWRADIKGTVSDMALADPWLEGVTTGSAAVTATVHAGAGDTVHVSDLRIETPQLAAEGKLRLTEGGIAGRIDGRLADLAALSHASGRDLAGSARFAATLSGPLADPALEAEFTGSDVAVDATALPELAGSLRLADLASGPHGAMQVTARGMSAAGPIDLRDGTALDLDLSLADLAPFSGGAAAGKAEGKVSLRLKDGASTIGGRIRIADLEAGPLTGGTLVVELSGPPEGARFDASLEASLPQAAEAQRLSLNASGRLAAGEEATTVSVERLDGRVGTYPVSLVQPARLVLGAVPVASVPGLAVGPGVVRGESRRDDGGLRLVVEAEGFPVAIASLLGPAPPVSGTLSANADVALRPGGGQGSIVVRGTELKPTGRALADVVPVQVSLEGRLDGQTLLARLSVAGASDQPLAAEVRLPLAWPATAMVPAPARDRAVAGHVRWTGPVRRITPFLTLVEHQVSGTVDVDLTLAGTLDDPAVNGAVRLVDGRYENLVTGTLVQGLDAGLRADGTRNLAFNAQGRGADGGSMNADGTVRVGGESLLSADARLVLQRLAVLHRDEVKAWASGDLALDWGKAGGLLSGTLIIDGVEARLIQSLPPSVVSLDVVEIGPGAAPKGGAGDKQPGDASGAVRLDVAVSIPGKAFVRGRGLDSEWSGDLKVAGTASEPRLSGSLSVVRGQYSFIGKTFRITEGTIRFDGRPRPDPRIDLRAETETDARTVIVAASGAATDPRIDLRARPPLPEDEIVSTLLFGKRTGQLSPLEAVQVAQAVGELTGTTGIGIVERIRGALGLDVLDAGAGDGKGPRVTAGKYIGDKVFVGVSQGAGAQSGSVTVEVEVSPHVTVDTEVGHAASGAVGLNWKMDY